MAHSEGNNALRADLAKDVTKDVTKDVAKDVIMKKNSKNTSSAVTESANSAHSGGVSDRGTSPEPLHVADDHLVRVHKVLASAGVASRRASEQLIAEGRVTVDGQVVRTQGMRVDPESAVITVDGDRIITSSDQVYLVLNKPLGMQSTMSDELGRPCIGDIVSQRVKKGQRIFHVGRLDANTEGLILLTNDGELAHRMMHPSYGVPKTYLVQVRGVFSKKAAKELLDGVKLDDGVAAADKVTILGTNEAQSHVCIVIHEGRKHIVRRMFDAVGYPVTGLVRTHIGPVALQDQRPGSLRALNSKEIASLYELVKL